MEEKVNSQSDDIISSQSAIAGSSGSYPFSTSGSYGSDDEYRDTQLLLTTVPQLVWDIIVNEMYGKDDIVQLLNCSLFFRAMLIKERTEHLFSQVWNVLGEKYEEMNDIVYDERPEIEQSNQPIEPSCSSSGRSLNLSIWGDCTFCRFCRRRRYTRSYSGILKLRLINKTWSKAIDQFYQTPRERWVDPKDTDTPLLLDRTLHWKDYIFANFGFGAPRGRDFLQHFNSSGHRKAIRSPFLGKSILIMLKLVDDPPYRRIQNIHFQNVNTILEIHGRVIEECAIKITRDCRFGREHRLLRLEYLTLRQLLNMMPNLKSLYVESASHDSELYNLDPLQGRRTQFINFISNRPLPQLNYLDYICTKLSCSLILKELLRRNNHISNLQVVDSRPFFQNGAYETLLPRLTNLWIKFISMEDFLRFSEHEVNWPLTKLWIRFRKYFVLDWSHLFRVLRRKWGDSLLALDVSLPEQTTGKIITTGKLRLHALQTLTLVAPRNASLDFILPMKDTLECLDVTVFQKFISLPIFPEEEKRITLSCNKYLGSYKIWERLPKLKLVRFTDYLPNDSYSQSWQLRCFYRFDCERRNAPQLRPPRRRWQWCLCQ